MRRPIRTPASGALILLAVLAAMTGLAAPSAAQWQLDDMVTQESGMPVYHGMPIDSSLQNDWPQQLEREFQARARRILTAQTRDIKPGVNTYFENEKRTYGYLMAHVLSGQRELALCHLQAQDHQHEAWHRETAGIDYYACFTLKHQMRKYFYFGGLLDPAYRQQMRDGAKRWTAQDPLRRPHYAHDPTKSGWGPDAMNSWVDVRSTENLFLMRVTSVYLMAEETGNAATAKKYKQYLLNYASTLYRVGIGEWDSENYHGHSIAPLLNVYDFAKDMEVKSAAKACLDFFAIAGAVKYYRGGFNGPTKRDYNHAQPFGGSAANSLWVWFGEHPSGKSDHWESDEVHQITSAYRPPMAAVRLAQKRFDRPVEVFAAKPSYDATTKFQADNKPEYAETQYIGHSFQMGSLTGGTSTDGGDVNGFKLLVRDDDEGAVALHAAPTADPAHPGSPMYKQGVIAAPNRVAQMQNLALWLVKDGKSPWLWVAPKHIKVRVQEDVTFLISDHTWVAIRPLGTGPLRPDAERTKQLTTAKKTRFPDHQVLSARGVGGAYCGLAVEVGERETHGSFERFEKDVLAAEVDLSDLSEGAVRYKSADGKWLGIHWNDDPLNLGVWRNGKRRDLSQLPLYQSPIISAEWGSGQLDVSAGDSEFHCRVSKDGIVSHHARN